MNWTAAAQRSPQRENHRAERMEGSDSEGFFDKNDENEQALPAVSVGDERKVFGSEIKEGKTSPPKHFTDVIFCERKEWIGIEERSSA